MKEVHINYHAKNSPLVHEFNIIKDSHDKGEDEVTRLVRVDGGGWSSQAKGKEAARITDTGDGLFVEISDDNRELRFPLDYDQAEELFILLSQQEFAPFEIRESKTTMKWPLSQ